MAEITYLLGAGASCGALPVVSDMYQKIGEAIAWFDLAHRQAFPRFSQHGAILLPKNAEKEDAELAKITSDLNWLKEICNTRKNFSVDTYARKLEISGNHSEYIKLKNILAFYFTLEQRRNLPDVRYDNFWASILKSRKEFPDNIKIISWNYDFQLELTYQDFFGHQSLKVAREALNLSSLETDMFDLRDSSKFGIFKLNGSATFNSNTVENRETSYFIDQFTELSIEDFIPRLIEVYNSLCTKPKVYKNHLSFAWEHKTNSDFFAQLKDAVKNTEILVVIGYSFPFFNRNIDRMIINDFMSKFKLNKVYFQAPDAEDLRERFLAINDTIDQRNLVLRKDLMQFTLPNEV